MDQSEGEADRGTEEQRVQQAGAEREGGAVARGQVLGGEDQPVGDRGDQRAGEDDGQDARGQRQ
ncbi:hypothetical protein [Streptomyces avidinii]|uniref:Uncharacterized protein n=1 Tax=Streptomyces avidinii TaxID=1895 RepID=A0ABS4L5T1_STRAV|nr:hypothetical protein [Streptomyces avidinii]MBP2037469.1 hypothetical protein [Streptomyces avidinii]